MVYYGMPEQNTYYIYGLFILFYNFFSHYYILTKIQLTYSKAFLNV